MFKELFSLDRNLIYILTYFVGIAIMINLLIR
jgi:hypothetical protein